MSTFNITSSALNNDYEYANTDLRVDGSSTLDATNNTLTRISGSVYDVSGGTYIGRFDGYMRDGVIKYNVTDMPRSSAVQVFAAIAEIESYAIPQQAASEE